MNRIMTYDILVCKGDDFKERFYIKDTDSSLENMSLEGARIVLQARNTEFDYNTKLELSTDLDEDGKTKGITIVDNNRSFEIHIPEEVSALITDKNMKYNLRIITKLGVSITLLQGLLRIIPSMLR